MGQMCVRDGRIRTVAPLNKAASGVNSDFKRSGWSLPRSLTWATLLLFSGCSAPPNNPYPPEDDTSNTLYSSFEERPKHLDPARAYSQNEYEIISQIVEPPLQYAYLKRPYELEPLALAKMPNVWFVGEDGSILSGDIGDKIIKETVYELEFRSDLRYPPHPAFALGPEGLPLYHALETEDLRGIKTPEDFGVLRVRHVEAADFAYQIKRLVHPRVHSPIGELMADVIVGLRELGERLRQESERTDNDQAWLDLRPYELPGVEVMGPSRLRIHVKGLYPQFRFWLAMPFFAPTPWEVDAFYSQAVLKAKNFTLDWFPVGSGPYRLLENNPNRRMVLSRNPEFHPAFYPSEGEPGDAERGLLEDQGKKLPLIDRIVFVLEKETIPYWSKFLQGYYDASGLASDNFDQAIEFSGVGNADLTPEMKARGIQLETTVNASILYLGFNMLDPVVGGLEEKKSALRRALSLAIDEEEFISIFMNGRGIPAQGLLPPGIFGHLEGPAGINPYLYEWQSGRAIRRPLSEARSLMIEAGYPNGIDPETQKPLVLFLDTTLQGAEDKPLLNWYRKQFQKLGIDLVLRTTDYNQFQQKMANGNAQLYRWGWNADYPDPENFLFLLYGENSKVVKGGENASNYQNPVFDRLFEQARNLPDGPERLELIQSLQALIRHDAPWVFGVHPKSFTLHHGWYRNLKPHLMANNHLKYLRIDAAERALFRRQWNAPILWPMVLLAAVLVLAGYFGFVAYRARREASGRC